MTGNQQETDKIQDIRKFEFYRILGKECKAMQDGGLTIEQIKESGSKIRNRCIAEVFSRMKIL